MSIPLGIIQSQTDVFMMQDAAKRIRNRGEKSLGIEIGNDGVVDLEQNAQAVALIRKLLLILLGAFVIERIIHGDGHLPRYLLHEIDIRFAIRVSFAHAKRRDVPAGAGRW